MRFFPADDVPGLTTYAEELPKPWVMPPYPRAHRDRLATMLGRTVERFDPRVRMISLRWVDRIVITEGRMRMPERALVWWRIEEGSRPKDPFHEARLLGGAFHLFDADERGLPLLLGWLAPLKIQLLHRIHDVLEKERTFSDPTPVLDALELAAERLVSPIDLLDFAERLITTHGAGLPIADAEAEGYAVVIAARFIPPQTSASSPFSAQHREAADHFVAALEACRASEEAPAAARAVLSRHAFVEPMHGDVPLLIEAFRSVPSTASFPGSLDIVDRIAWRVGGERGKPLPEIEPAPPPVSTLEVDAEAEADFVMASIRTRRDRDWTLDRRREGALALRRLADTLKEARGEKLTPDLVMREALLHQTASEQLERVGDRVEAARAANDASERWYEVSNLEEALTAAQRATALVRDLTEPEILADSTLSLAWALHRLGREDAAMAAAVAALELFRTNRDVAGEGTARALLTEVHASLGRLEEAILVASAAIDLFHQEGDASREAGALNLRARLHLKRDADEQALADLTAGLALCEGPGWVRVRGHLLFTRGQLHRVRARHVEALADFEEAIRIFEATIDRVSRSYVLLDLGMLRRVVGDAIGARGALEEAISIFEQTKHHDGEASARLERANLRLASNDVEGASEDIAVAKGLVKGKGSLELLAEAAFQAAQLAYRRRDFPAALLEIEEAEHGYEQSGSNFDRANVLAFKAEVLLAAGRPEEARAVANRARPIAKAAQNAWATQLTSRVSMRAILQTLKGVDLGPRSEDPPKP